jgi:DNA-binding phage protein
MIGKLKRKRRMSLSSSSFLSLPSSLSWLPRNLHELESTALLERLKEEQQTIQKNIQEDEPSILAEHVRSSLEKVARLKGVTKDFESKLDRALNAKEFPEFDRLLSLCRRLDEITKIETYLKRFELIEKLRLVLQLS